MILLFPEEKSLRAGCPGVRDRGDAGKYNAQSADARAVADERGLQGCKPVQRCPAPRGSWNVDQYQA